MAVLQRTQEIGVMKIVGGKNKQVSRFYTTECFLIGVIGTIIGLAAAVLVSFTVGSVLSWEIIIKPIYILYVILVSIGSPLLAGLLTQGRIAKLDPIAAFNQQL
jgi:ABC-type antimicrobial peptide transport system permease subunit